MNTDQENQTHSGSRRAARVGKRLAAVSDEMLALLRADTTGATLAALQGAEDPDPAWVEARVQNMLVAQKTLLRDLRQLRGRATVLAEEYQSLREDSLSQQIQEQAILMPLEARISRTEENIENLNILRRKLRLARTQADLCLELRDQQLLAALAENIRKGEGSR